MGFYSGTAMEMLCEQVVRDNPEMAGRISPETVIANGAVRVTSDNGRNTSITFNGVAGKGFLGELVLYYDRIQMQKLFGGVAAGPVTIPYRATTRAQMLPYVNEQLGLNLTLDDIASPDVLAAYSTTKTATSNMTILAGSVCYSGVLSFVFVREDPAFVDLYLPENNVNSLWRNPSPAAAVYNKSWHPYATQLGAVQKNTALRSNQTGVAAFISVLKSWSGIPFECGTTLGAGDYDITDSIITATTTKATPDSNQNYSNLLIVTPTPGKHKWTVPLYLHYTPKVAETVTASAEDFENWVQVSGNPIVTPDEFIRAYAGKSVIVDMGALRDTDVYYGNVWGKEVYAALSGMHRVAQHCFPTQECFDYAVANKLKVLLTITALVAPTTAYNQTARNGYTSLFYTQAGGTSGVRVNAFTYYDVRYGNMRTLNPFAAPAVTATPTIWLP